MADPLRSMLHPGRSGPSKDRGSRSSPSLRFKRPRALVPIAAGEASAQNAAEHLIVKPELWSP
jgi:hypothetical protein